LQYKIYSTLYANQRIGPSTMGSFGAFNQTARISEVRKAIKIYGYGIFCIRDKERGSRYILNTFQPFKKD